MSAAKQRYLASLARLRLEESDDSIEGIDSTDSGDSSDSLESGGSVVVSKASTVTSQGGVSAVVKASTGVVGKEVNAKNTITRGLRTVVAKRALTVVVANPAVPANSGAPKVPSSPLLRKATASRRKTSIGRQPEHNKTSPPTHMRYLSNDSNSDSSSKRENSKSAVNKLSSSDGVRLVPTFETSQTSVTASLESLADKKPVPRSIGFNGGDIDTPPRSIDHPGISRSDSSLSPSSSKSFKSVASKQLDRLKRLAIGSVQKGSTTTSVASVGMSEKIEVLQTDISQIGSVSSTNKNSRTRELYRLKTLTHIHPGKYTNKGEKWRGQRRFGEADGGSAEPSKSEHEGEHDIRSVPQTPVSKKATFRERQLTRRSNTPTQRQSQSSEVDSSMASYERGTKLPPLMTPPKRAILNAAAMSTRCDLRVDNRNDEDVRNDSTSSTRSISSTRAGRRRSRSLIRSPGMTTQSSITQRSSSSPRAAPAGTTLTIEADRQTKVELCDKRGIATKDASVRGPNLPPKGVKLRSRSPALRSEIVAVVAKDTRIRDVAPIRMAICKVSKPSRLASLSIAILSKAVVPIQRLARSFLAKIAIDRWKKNILVMQSLIRRWTCIRYFHSAQTIALKFQGVYRGMIARDRLDFLHYCSVRVQSAFRGFSCYLTFITTLSKIILLQSVWRMAHQRKTYLTYLEDRRQLEVEEEAALMIQTNYRRHRAMSDILQVYVDVIVCQSVVRRFLALKHTHSLRQDKCATRIQASWRRFLASEYFIFILTDIIACQSVVRRWIEMVKYKAMRAERSMAAIAIQKTYRGFSKCIPFRVLVFNIITTQSIVRRWSSTKGVCALRQIQHENHAVTKLQATYRGYITRMEYLITLDYVVTCQCAARRMMAKRELQGFCKEANELRAATKIQNTYRGYVARSDYSMLIYCAITLQSVARATLAKKELQIRRYQKQGATLIQTAYRGFVARSDYSMSIYCAITLQSVVRVALAKKELYIRRQQKNAATLIQATYRRHIAIEYFVLIVHEKIMGQMEFLRHSETFAASTIQASHFGYAAALRARKQLLIARAAATKIQSGYRVLAARANVRKIREHRAATKIRAAYLGYTAKMNYIFTVADIITIQTTLRGFHVRKNFHHVIRSVVTLQSEVRRMIAKRKAKYLRVQEFQRKWKLREVKAVTTIQCFWRLSKAQTDYNAVIWSTTRIQSSWRSYKAHVDYACMIYGFICLQAKFRQRRAMIECTTTRHLRNAKAATLIQSSWRSYKSLTDYACMIYGFICLQAKFRQRRAMIEYTTTRHLRNAKAATLIQSNWRSYKSLTDYACMIYGVISIQTKFRQRRAMIAYTKSRSAIRIQTCWRLYKALVDYDTVIWGATRIQSFWRSYKTQIEYETKIWAAVLIQTTFRCHLVGCKAKLLQVLSRGADIQTRDALSVLTIQERWRTVCDQRRHRLCERNRLENFAATVIQSCFRGYRDFLQYAILSLYVVQIQACVRRHMTLSRVKMLKSEAMKERERESAVIAIQSCFRGHRESVRYLMISFAVIRAQAFMRGRIARSKLTLEVTAATNIQSCFRGFRNFVRYVITQYFIIKVQSRARIYLARQQLKQLKREDRDRKIRSGMWRNKTNPVVYKKKKNETQLQRETRAAIVIQHFFIKIKAEIEREIIRMKKKAALKKKTQSKSLSRSNTYNSSSSSHVRNESTSDQIPQIPSMYSVSSSGNDASVSYRVTKAIRIATQSLDRNRQNTPSEASPSNPYRLTNTTPRIVTNISMDSNRHHTLSQASTSYENSTHHIESLPRKRMPSIQAIAQQSGYGPPLAYNQAMYVPPPQHYGVSHAYYTSSSSHNASHPYQSHNGYGPNKSMMLHHYGHHPQQMIPNPNPPRSSSYEIEASPVLSSHYPEMQQYLGKAPPAQNHNVQYNMRHYQTNNRY